MERREAAGTPNFRARPRSCGRTLRDRMGGEFHPARPRDGSASTASNRMIYPRRDRRPAPGGRAFAFLRTVPVSKNPTSSICRRTRHPRDAAPGGAISSAARMCWAVLRSRIPSRQMAGDRGACRGRRNLHVSPNSGVAWLPTSSVSHAGAGSRRQPAGGRTLRSMTMKAIGGTGLRRLFCDGGSAVGRRRWRCRVIRNRATRGRDAAKACATGRFHRRIRAVLRGFRSR